MDWLQIISPECFCRSSEFVMESEIDTCYMSWAIENGKIAFSSSGMIFFSLNQVCNVGPTFRQTLITFIAAEVVYQLNFNVY